LARAPKRTAEPFVSARYRREATLPAIQHTLSGLLVATALLPAHAEPQTAWSSTAPRAQFADSGRLGKLRSALPAVDELMRSFATGTNVPGIAWGIVVDGKLIHVGTAGLRELSSSAPVDSTTVFRIASMTKSFTALAILQLRDAGKLSLDDPAERYVPELKGLRYPTSDSPRLTIRHLLSHSAGFPEDNPWGDQQLAATSEDMARMMTRGIPFSTAPGTTYEYSNFGFAILGRIVANASGLPYPRYVSERLLAPLGMRVTTLEAGSVDPKRLAHGYRRQDTLWLEEKQLPDGAFGSMGGMLTSVSDLGRYVGFMLDAWPPRDGPETGPVRRASVREMQQVARYSGASTNLDTSTGTVQLSAGGYGYGLGVRQDCFFRVSVAHSGGLPGFGSLMRWLPEYGVGIVALGNLTYTSWGRPVEQAFGLLFRTGGLVPRVAEPAPVLVTAREQVSRLVARWDDAVADSIAAMNLYLDESKERRRLAIERVRREAGDQCRNEGPFEVENALRGRWRMRCASGDLRVTITLAPTEPAGVQFLDVSPMRREASLAALPTCR
jgi:CubicO group peptidase (beta-lactamase class C family)